MSLLLVVSALLLMDSSEASQKPDPVSAYHLENIRGWDVHIHKTLLREDRETGEAARELLDYQLYEITRRVPKQALTQLQKIPIWLERDNDKQSPCACYHVSADWLEANGFLREKAKAVEISNAQRFLEWTKDQPFMVLHELAHGYHDQNFGYDDARIEEAFQQAKKSGTYDEVLHIGGGKQKHYALQNAMEYFAEGSEAYFGTNDFYPFTRAELKQHDPEGYRLLESLWNEAQPMKAEKEEAETATKEDEESADE